MWLLLLLLLRVQRCEKSEGGGGVIFHEIVTAASSTTTLRQKTTSFGRGAICFHVNYLHIDKKHQLTRRQTFNLNSRHKFESRSTRFVLGKASEYR